MMADHTTDLVGRAAAYARAAHFGDVRKGTGVSYYAGHLAPVAEIVRRDGGTEIQIAGAYLHDVAEDHGGHARLDDVRAEFGDEVAQIVEDLSDSLVDTEAPGVEKEPWKIRKTRYVASLASKPAVSLVVAAADKVHNATSIVADFEAEGDALWRRFNTDDPADHLWYYRSLAAGIIARLPDHATAKQLVATVDELAAALRSASG